MNCKFDDYLNLLTDVFRSCQQNEEYHENQLFINYNRRGILEVQTKNEMRKFTLLNLEFVAVPEDIVKTSIAYRYSVLKAKNDLLEGRLVDVVKVVKRSNPSLGLLITNYLQNKI